MFCSGSCFVVVFMFPWGVLFTCFVWLVRLLFLFEYLLLLGLLDSVVFLVGLC